MNLNEHEELNHILAKAVKTKPSLNRNPRTEVCCEEKQEEKFVGTSQFTTGDGIRFFPAGKTTSKLPPGVYEVSMSNMKGIFFQKLPVVTDGLIRFPETNSEKVIEEIQKFWAREEAFKSHGIKYQRGIVLWGPAGSGKTCTIQLVISDVVQRGGVCFKFSNPHLFCEGLRVFREVQPQTEVVVLMEDIDSIIEDYSESEVLNLLDGVDQGEKLVYLATTNYPEVLGARILNRPSRFDKRFKMGHPGKKSRELYFKHLISEIAEYNIELNKWVKDTEGMSIAHLKELFISVCIFGNNYKESVDTLRFMNEEHPKSFEDGKIGFVQGEYYED